MSHDESEILSPPAGSETPGTREEANSHPEAAPLTSDAVSESAAPVEPAVSAEPAISESETPAALAPHDESDAAPEALEPSRPAGAGEIKEALPPPMEAEVVRLRRLRQIGETKEALPPPMDADPDKAGETEEALPPPVEAEAGEAGDAETDSHPAPPVEPLASGGPNWMLAFVSAWAGGFALFQVWQMLPREDLAPNERTFALVGFGALGVGLFAFALEALLWNRNNRRGLRGLLLTLAVLLTLAGVVCLFLFNDPDPTKGRI